MRLIKYIQYVMGCFLLGYTAADECPVVCEWVEWNQWSACNSTCGGGDRIRDRPLCCNTLWSVDQCIYECGIIVSDAVETEGCNEFCYNSGTFIEDGGCECLEQNHGKCCDNDVVCGPPSSLINGFYEGFNFSYGGEITYHCNDGYNLTYGDAVHICRKQSSDDVVGYWEGTVPMCAYVESCNSNPCMNGGYCLNGLDSYNCSCLQGWTGTLCEYDIQPPVYDQCPDNVTEYTSSRDGLLISWSAPTFSDPFGNEILVTGNYDVTEKVFPWGEYVVQYVGRKTSNGMEKECIFSVSVYPIQCAEPSVPENGALACNGWNSRFTEVCFVFCDERFNVPIGTDIRHFFLCGASGEWSSPIEAVECTEPSGNETTEFPASFYTGNCTTDIDTKANISQNYINMLRESDFAQLCSSPEWQDNCVSDQVTVIC